MMEDDFPVAPDGGWGWVVVFCSFYIHAICMGMTMALGVLYVSWLNAFQSGKSETSWIVSIAVAVMYSIGPFAAGLAIKIGYRAMTIVGGLMMAVGFLLSTFASSVFALIITIGVIAGAGFGLSYLASIAVPAFYFDKKRSMAMGLGSAGTGAGTFLLAPLMNWLIDVYGWRGTMMFLSGLCLNICVVGALMRPLEAPKDSTTAQSITVANNKGHIKNSKETDALIISSETISPGDVKELHGVLVPTSISESINTAGVEDLSSLAFSNESIRAEKKKRKIAFMNVSPAHSDDNVDGTIHPGASTESPKGEEKVSQQGPQSDSDKNNNGADSSQDALVLKERDTNIKTPEVSVSRKNEANKSNPSKKYYVNKPVKGGPFHHYKSDIPKMTRKNSFGSKSHNIHRDKRVKDKLRTNINLMLDYTPSYHPPATFIHLADLSNDRFLSRLERRKLSSHDRDLKSKDMDLLELPRSVSDQKLNRSPSLSTDILRPPMQLETTYTNPIIGGSMHQLATTLPSELDVEASRGYRSVIELATGGASRNLDKLIASIKPRDVYLSGSMYNLMALERTLSHSRKSLHRVSHDRTKRQSLRSLIRSDLSMYRRPREPDEPTLLQKIKEGVKANFLLCKDPTFLMFALSNFLTNLSLVMPMVFMVDRAISFGISKESAALLLSLNGAGTICGRVTSALVADRKWMNRLLTYILTLTFAGIATSFSPLCRDSLALHATYASLFGLLTGIYGALCPCVLVDLKGIDSVGQSYGLLLLYMGISTLIGTPLGGLIYDLCGNYSVPFILHGAFITFSGLLLVPLLLKRIKLPKKH